MGLDTSVVAWTERALLNSTVLDWICPPNCEKNKINQVGNSAIEALQNSTKDLFSNRVKEDMWHWGTKPIKAMARVAYTAIVSITVSPLGAVFNGVMTVGHLVHYSFKTYEESDPSQQEKWDKISQYFHAFVSDFSCFLVGGTAIFAMAAFGTVLSMTGSAILSGTAVVGLASTLAGKIMYFVFSGAICAGSAHFLGAYYPSYYLARLLGDSENRTGMYLALEMRNQFGLVDQDGNLLRFSAADKLEYETQRERSDETTYNFEGDVFENLIELVIEAELDLVNLIRQANQWLEENHHSTIPFAHPFDGVEIAKILQKILDEDSDQHHAFESSLAAQSEEEEDSINVHELIANLKMMDHKVNVFREFLPSSQEMAMKGSLVSELLQALGQTTTVNIDRPAVYTSQEFYKECFELPYVHATKDEQFNLNSVYEQCNIEPSNAPIDDSISPAQKFPHLLALGKWKLSVKEKPSSPYKLLGLKKNVSATQLKQTFRNFDFALHPDKNGSTEEANEIYKAYGRIKEHLRKEMTQES